MYLIGVYDICTSVDGGSGRLVKVMKTFRKYLHHSQKSVFEGEISNAKFFALRKEVNALIDERFDYVLFYRVDNLKNIKRVNIGLNFDPTSPFI